MNTSRTSFEGVCETHVILTPGACGSGAPNSTSCHHFRGTSWTRGTSWDWEMNSKKLIFAALAHTLEL